MKQSDKFYFIHYYIYRCPIVVFYLVPLQVTNFIFNFKFNFV